MAIEGSLPQWLERRYSILWDTFKSNPFTLSDAIAVLSEKNKDKEKEVPVFLSEIKRSGWLQVGLDPKDSRKKFYTLKSKEEIIDQLLTFKPDPIGRGEIEAILKKAADLIRTRVDYKFILVLLFLKRLSDKWELEFQETYEEAKEEGLSDEEAREEAKRAPYHKFDLPEEYLWDNIRKNVESLPEKFSTALKTIGERNPELRDVFDNVDFIQFTASRENAEILRQLVELFSERKLHNVSPDILGDAYEWILRYFSPDRAKEGEVYTPREVIKLLVEILNPQPGESIYDPASASNGMLIISYKHVQDKHGKKGADKLFLYGQEANQKTLALGRMNLYIHDIMNAQLAFGDTLLYPKFKEGETIKKFDIVIANPPWNQDGYDEEVLKKGEFWRQRFSCGFPPSQSADWAWVQHMLASADEKKGRVGIVIDNGCLFRAGKEGAIRKQIVDKDLIECVILLPEKLFYNTGAPGAILILRHQKPKERAGKILFINATQKFEKHLEVKKLNRLGDKQIQEILKAYNDFGNTDSFSRVVSKEDIAKNDYNLSVTRYVDISGESEHVDIPQVWKEVQALDKDLQALEVKIGSYLKEIGYEN